MKKTIASLLLIFALLILSRLQAGDEPPAPVCDEYLVKLVSDKIIVYNGEDIYMAPDIDVENLREHDKNMFSKGVGLNTETELYMLLEDFAT